MSALRRAACTHCVFRAGSVVDRTSDCASLTAESELWLQPGGSDVRCSQSSGPRYLPRELAAPDSQCHRQNRIVRRSDASRSNLDMNYDPDPGPRDLQGFMKVSQPLLLHALAVRWFYCRTLFGHV